MDERPEVKNAGDEQQVKSSRQRDKRVRERELSDLRVTLSTKEGRRFYWRLMSHCGAFRSVWEPSARIHYNSGRQDVGHFLLAEVDEAGNELFEKMKNEAKREIE